VFLAGIGVVGLGLWARRDVRRGLARERIVAPGGGDVVSAASARELAETIRAQTLEATGGKTYSETGIYLAADGTATSDEAQALADEATGKPVPNPNVDLWIQSTTLQTALMQAYMAFRLSDLMLALGGALALAGVGITAAARR
jgi:uncharacterized protein YbjT (DUF2867 family)